MARVWVQIWKSEVDLWLLYFPSIFFVSSGRTSSQPWPALHSSLKSIRNFGPTRSHFWAKRARQLLFVKSSFTLTTESIFRQKRSLCLSHRWPGKSVRRSSPLVWSTSRLFECHALIWNCPFASTLSWYWLHTWPVPWMVWIHRYHQRMFVLWVPSQPQGFQLVKLSPGSWWRLMRYQELACPQS